MVKFQLDVEHLLSLSQVAQKFIGAQSNFVYFFNTSDSCIIFVQGIGRWVRLVIPSIMQDPVSFGVEASRFFVFCKSLKGSEAKCRLGKTLDISGSGFSAKFPLVVGVVPSFEGGQVGIVALPSGFMDALHLGGSVDVDLSGRFSGILLFPRAEGITQLAKFSGTAVALSNLGGFVMADRCVISESFLSLASLTFFTACRTSLKFFELFTDFGLAAGAMLLTDTYPESYHELGVGDTKLVEGLSGLRFTLSELRETLGGLKSLCGAEGGSVLFSIVGGDARGELVCRCEVATISNVQAHVEVFSEAVGSGIAAKFSVRLATLVKVLQGLAKGVVDDLVYLYEVNGSSIAVAGSDKKNVVVLSKMR